MSWAQATWRSHQDGVKLLYAEGPRAKLSLMAEWPKGKVAWDDRVVACGKVAPEGLHPKVEASYLDLKGPQSLFQWCVTTCPVRLEDTSFWLKSWKLKVSWLLCIGRLVSKTENVMHLAHMCRLVVLLKWFIYDAWTQATWRLHQDGVLHLWAEWPRIKLSFMAVLLKGGVVWDDRIACSEVASEGHTFQGRGIQIGAAVLQDTSFWLNTRS